MKRSITNWSRFTSETCSCQPDLDSSGMSNPFASWRIPDGFFPIFQIQLRFANQTSAIFLQELRPFSYFIHTFNKNPVQVLCFYYQVIEIDIDRQKFLYIHSASNMPIRLSRIRVSKILLPKLRPTLLLLIKFQVLAKSIHFLKFSNATFQGCESGFLVIKLVSKP